jgi:hypothetical protein
MAINEVERVGDGDLVDFLFMCDSGDRWVLCEHHSLIVSQHNKSLIEMERTNIQHLAYSSSNLFGKILCFMYSILPREKIEKHRGKTCDPSPMHLTC